MRAVIKRPASVLVTPLGWRSNSTTKLRLDLGNGLGQSRLRQIHGVRRAADAAQPRGGSDGLEVAKVEFAVCNHHHTSTQLMTGAQSNFVFAAQYSLP